MPCQVLPLTTAWLGSIRSWASFVDPDISAFDGRTVEVLDCLLAIFLVFHLNKTEAFRISGVSVLDDVHPHNGSELFKQSLQVVFAYIVRQIAAINIHFLVTSLCVESIDTIEAHNIFDRGLPLVGKLGAISLAWRKFANKRDDAKNGGIGRGRKVTVWGRKKIDAYRRSLKGMARKAEQSKDSDLCCKIAHTRVFRE